MNSTFRPALQCQNAIIVAGEDGRFELTILLRFCELHVFDGAKRVGRFALGDLEKCLQYARDYLANRALPDCGVSAVGMREQMGPWLTHPPVADRWED